MLTEAQTTHSEPDLLSELQAFPVTKAVIYRNRDRKAWKPTAKEHQSARVMVAVEFSL